MDKRILLTVFFVIVIVGGILLYNILFPSCTPPAIQLLTERPEAGQVVTFSGISEDDENILWDFGDSTVGTSGTNVSHIYKTTGAYTVIARVGKCEMPKQIIVERSRDTVRVPLSVSLPPNVRANELVTLKDLTKDAMKWKWYIEKTKDSSMSAALVVKFPKPGEYKVALSMTGNYVKGDTAFMVNVMPPVAAKKFVSDYVPPPPPKKPEVPRVEKRKYMTDSEFKVRFQEIANLLSDESSNASEDWKEIVNQSCLNPPMTVFMIDENKKSRPVSLDRFKTILLAEGDFYVEAVEVLPRTKADGCISSVRVITKKN